jgi:hypothetical protein
MTTDPLTTLRDTLAAAQDAGLGALPEFATLAGQLEDLGAGDMAGLADLFQQAQAEMQRFQGQGGVTADGPTNAEQAAIDEAIGEMMNDIVGFAYQMIQLQQQGMRQLLHETTQL